MVSRFFITLALSMSLISTAPANEPFMGQIEAFGTNFCPRGWTETKGQLLPVSKNTALFSLLGTIYGGDGRTTFALPKLQANGPGDNPKTIVCIAIIGVYPSRN